MRQQLLVSAALAIGLTSTALAADVETLEPAQPDEQRIARQCLEDLQAFDQQLLEAEFGVLPPGGYGLGGPTGFYGFPGTPREQIQALRGAAQVLAYQGDEVACQQVLSKMRGTFEAHQQLAGLEADDPPVVQDGRLSGIVSRADVLRGLASVSSARAERPSADDRQIRDKILALLKERSDASTRFVSVIVVGGTVYLWGTAESEQDRVAIRVAAENVAGVKAVHDLLGCLPEVLKGVW
jgi:osmotically-inducible protein OsmY